VVDTVTPPDKPAVLATRPDAAKIAVIGAGPAA